MKKLGTVLIVLAILGTLLVSCAQTAAPTPAPAPPPAGKIGPVGVTTAGKTAVTEVLGVYTAKVATNFVTNDTITLGDKTLTVVASNPTVGTSFVAGTDAAGSVTNIVAALVGNMPTNYTVTGATDTLTATQTVGSPTPPVLSNTGTAVLETATTTAGVAGVTEVKGEYTVKVTENFVAGDKITIENKVLTAAASGTEAGTFVVAETINDTVTAIKEAANKATAVVNYTVTSATDTLTLTQTVGKDAKPVVTFTAKP